MQDALFYIFSFLTLLCGLLVVANPFSRNPVTSAMFLVLAIASLAGLFVLLDAFFSPPSSARLCGGRHGAVPFVIMLLDVKEEQRRKIKKFGLVTGIISVGPSSGVHQCDP